MALRYKNSVMSLDGKKVRQVNIKVANKYFNNGRTVWLHPCNMKINNPWQSPMAIKANGMDGFSNDNKFMSMVSDFRYYNCNKELGRYPIFFVETDDNVLK